MAQKYTHLYLGPCCKHYLKNKTLNSSDSFKKKYQTELVLMCVLTVHFV